MCRWLGGEFVSYRFRLKILFVGCRKRQERVVEATVDFSPLLCVCSRVAFETVRTLTLFPSHLL